jgi:hypothetical protein
MTHGANLGRLLCIALTSCAGFAFALVMSIVFCPAFLFVVSTFRHRSRDEPPFQWLEPMFLMITVCAVLGGCAAGIVAWWHLRAGRLPNKPQEAASREEANRES